MRRILASIAVGALTCGICISQQIGDIDTVGTTWYDLQHNGTCGRMICLDSQCRIHVVWTNGDNIGTRHVYYNAWDPQLGWIWGNVGIPAESTQRGGYTCLAMDSDDNTYIALHVITLATAPDAAAACITRSNLYLCPFVYAPYRLELIWPQIAVDINDRIHMINTKNPTGGTGYPQLMFYVGGQYNEGLLEIAWDDSQRVIDNVRTLSADITASRHTDRVAFTYCNMRTHNPETEYNNDIRLIVSEDGINWDFNDYINVTQFIPPDLSLLPDTTAANKDTFRTYTDASVLFDIADNIHVAFTTPFFDSIRGIISINNSLIWHWCDATGYYSLVADGWLEPFPYVCGAWQRFVQRPCIAEDESTGDLFIVYQQYDTSDIAANGYPQADIMISRSIDGGIRWSIGTNISNTHSPGAEAGYCMHEREITCNETIVNDTLCIFYILDKDAGSVIQSEGAWTLNYAICQRVPISEIPTIPLMPRYPMHVDSTGFPPESPVIDIDHQSAIPKSFQLCQNFPNPFNPTTNISFTICHRDHIKLTIYNITGQKITTLVNGSLNPGSYTVNFDANALASGIYFYKLSSSTEVKTRKMLLIK